MSNVIHSPISNPRRILDVGCGTGIVTTFLATQFPNAKIFGLDLAPMPQLEGRTIPSNIEYVQGDIMDLAGEGNLKDSTTTPALDAGKEAILEGNFDLIYLRLLMCRMLDWSGYLRKATSLLTPGSGWVEVHDLHSAWYDSSDNLISSSWEWNNVLCAAAEERGLDFACGKKAAGGMKDAGLVDITTTVYRWPFGGEWEDTGEMKNFGEFVVREMPRLLTHVISKVTERTGYSKEQVEEWRGQMKEDFRAEKGKHLKF